MNIQLFNNEKEELINFLCSNNWTYHSNPHANKSSILKAIEDGYYHDERETYWIILDEVKVGIIIIHDINDTIPLFDIRLMPNVRGKNIGTKALTWLKDYLFGQLNKIRIEGYTRADNLAMRKCFTKSGFVKEGYLRNAWENQDGTIFDSLLYSAIYTDWKENKITKSKIDDLPY